MITKIKDRLRDNPIELEKILNKIHCTKIHKSNKGFRFGRDNLSSGNANEINTSTLYYTSYSNNSSGDIIILVEEMMNISRGESIRWLANELGITYSYEVQKNTRLPFGGFYHQYLQYMKPNSDRPRTFDETLLERYVKGSCLFWVNDGISLQTQEFFGVMYDCISDRIILPLRDEEGNLCGAVGRRNTDNLRKGEPKYISMIEEAERGKLLFGLYENYSDIIEADSVIIVESEKSVMKARELGVRNVVAVGKHAISPRQAELLKSLGVSTYIIAFDEGIEVEECKKEMEKIISDTFFKKKNYFIVDMDNEYIPIGSKEAIFDLEKEEDIQKIMSEYLITV